MSNMNPRYGGRRGYNPSHPRAQGANQNQNIYGQVGNFFPMNAPHGYNSNTHFPPPTPPAPPPPLPPPPPSSTNSINGRINSYSNSNCVPPRMPYQQQHQQHSTQVTNPTEHQQQRQRQPVITNTVGDPTFPKQQVSPVPVPASATAPAPPLDSNVKENQVDSLATALVPFTNGANGSASNNPASSTTTPSQPPPPENSSTKTKPTSTEVEVCVLKGDSVSCEELVKFYGLLGKKIKMFAYEKEVKDKELVKLLLREEKLEAKIQALKSQISTMEQEMENQTKNYGEMITHEQEQAARARDELFTWRNNAINFSEQLESQKVHLSEKAKNMESLESQLAEVKREKDECMLRIQQLEQNEKKIVSEIQSKNNTIEKNQAEIKKNNEELARLNSQLKDKMKKMKEKDDEMNNLKEELNMKIVNEKKRVKELQTNVKDWKSKHISVMQIAEGYKADKEKLKGEKAKLETCVKEKNRCIETKEEEILILTEERNSIQVEKETSDILLQDQTKKVTDLKTGMDELREKVSQLSAELESEREMKKNILLEHMDMYTRPTILNLLIQESIQVPTLSIVGSGAVGLPVPHLTCSSPMASEEVPEPVSAEQDCSDRKLENGPENISEVGRKRKRSISTRATDDDVRQKDPKYSGNSVAAIEQKDEQTKPGSSQLKGQEGEGPYQLRVSSRRGSHCAVSTNADANIPVNQVNQERSADILTTKVKGTARNDKVRKTGKKDDSIKINIPNSNANFKKAN